MDKNKNNNNDDKNPEQMSKVLLIFFGSKLLEALRICLHLDTSVCTDLNFFHLCSVDPLTLDLAVRCVGEIIKTSPKLCHAFCSSDFRYSSPASTDFKFTDLDLNFVTVKSESIKDVDSTSNLIKKRGSVSSSDETPTAAVAVAAVIKIEKKLQHQHPNRATPEGSKTLDSMDKIKENKMDISSSVKIEGVHNKKSNHAYSRQKTAVRSSLNIFNSVDSCGSSEGKVEWPSLLHDIKEMYAWIGTLRSLHLILDMFPHVCDVVFTHFARHVMILYRITAFNFI